jgi:glycosyltransferase involved in cell wall biosynthesis
MESAAQLTVVIAAFNEEAALPLLHARLRKTLDGMELRSRVLYVDDGSRDRSWEVMQQIAQDDPSVALLRLSRNFGKEAALTAGLDRVIEGAVLVLDCDGQDPPELIPEFVALWREGTTTCSARGSNAKAKAGSSAPVRMPSIG